MIAQRRSPTVRRQSSVLRHNVTLDRTRTPGSRRARQARGDPNVSKPLTPPSKVRPSSTYYRWKAEYGGLQLSEAKRMRQLEDEIGSSRRSSLIPHSTARRSRDCSAESGGSSRAVDDRSYRDTRSPNQALWPPGASWKRMRAHAPRFERAEWDASTPCRDPACDWSQPRPAGIDSRWTVAGLPRSSGRRHLRSGVATPAAEVFDVGCAFTIAAASICRCGTPSGWPTPALNRRSAVAATATIMRWRNRSSGSLKRK
jgi:hypothetical protein